jgi:hypothetical protein
MKADIVAQRVARIRKGVVRRGVVASRRLAIVEYSRDLELAKSGRCCPTQPGSREESLVLIMEDTDDPSGESKGLRWEELEEALGR